MRTAWRSLVAGLVASAVAVTVGGLPAVATVEDDTSSADVHRSWAVSLLTSGTPSVRRAAEAALLGSDADLEAFADSGFDQALDADYRTSADVLASTNGPHVKSAASAALAGSPAELRAFVDGGFKSAWYDDERLRVIALLEASGPHTYEAAQAALDSSDPAASSEFLSSELATVQYNDERLLALTMVDGGENNSGPALDEAAQVALEGTAEKKPTPEDLHEFLVNGQHVARARDEEMATVRGLTEQSKQAGQVTATESLAASQASGRAESAAELARSAAQEALAEAKAAGGAAEGASSAAGRAADAAAAAEGAASEAVSASSAALRAAQAAADGARKATTAASLTAQAAAAAHSAAAAARTDAGRAGDALTAAEAARKAAAQVAALEAVRKERDTALDEAAKAATAAISASVNADAAAVAADKASGQAGVSAAQAKRTKAAARAAKAEAARAAEAAQRSLGFAQAAAAASDQAFDFAQKAGEHATRAAAAAEQAAAQAGAAGQAAAESAAHAEQATAASELAVAAARQAEEVQKLARDADAARLAEATDQGISDAQDAAAAERAAGAVAGEIAAGWDRGVAWDTEEDDRVSQSTRNLLAKASAEGAAVRDVLSFGRRAALALVGTGGEWTKAAAAEALAGDEVMLRSWLAQGRTQAAGQDNRARVWHLVDTLPDGPEKTAARASLEGNDAAVATFLRTRAYPGKVVDDRSAMLRILAANPGVTLYNATQDALEGTPQEAHEFLRTGQHVARAADDRLRILGMLETAGPEVEAAAQVALAGPASYASYFLTVGQYEAAQRDAEQAAHVHAVQVLVREAQRYAEKALEDAAEARRVAAVAKGAAAEAATHASQAKAAADQAAVYADQAIQSAAAAKTSAEQAAASAQTAEDAATKAQASADRAARSAVTAGAAASRAARDAASAQLAKSSAREAASAAAQDAAAAEQAAQAAAATYTAREREVQRARRSTEPGSAPRDAPAGATTASETQRYWNCLTSVDTALGSPGMCKDGLVAFGKALLNPAKCDTPSNRDSLGCRMYSEFQKVAGGNDELKWDLAQLALGVCGLIPGAGEVCDGLDVAVSAARGDWGGALLSMGAMIPGIGAAAGLAKVTKMVDKLRGTIKMVIAQADEAAVLANRVSGCSIVNMATSQARTALSAPVAERPMALALNVSTARAGGGPSDCTPLPSIDPGAGLQVVHNGQTNKPTGTSNTIVVADPADAAAIARKTAEDTARDARNARDAKEFAVRQLPMKTTAAVDPVTGRVTTGFSGELLTPPAGLQERMPTESVRPWPVNNCGEVAACTRQLEGVADIVEQRAILDRLKIITVFTRTGQVDPPCRNCEVWVPKQ
ncbi:hypothetical protein CCE01nite_16550 [Cellulomonas cellasea]|uniref:Methyl-accepting transducer domain-containing protein n=1 Tax=Cellulomonas cellasea TaxID=43670 RepID=A0A4Y3KWB7_9CELL|nr:hypothetical protein CCE01nite_16550 [Cellulomonas cellasea]